MAIEVSPERPAEEASQATTPEPSLGDKLGSRFRRWSTDSREILDTVGRTVTEFGHGIRDRTGNLAQSLSTPFLRKRVSAQLQLDKETEEVIDPYETLANLDNKSDIMKDQIEKGQVEQSTVWLARFLFRAWFHNLVLNGGIEGKEHLQNALVQSKTEDKRIIFTPLHRADADHPVAIFLMKRNIRKRKLGRGIQNLIVWMAGVNMKRRPAIERFMRAAHVIYNRTPRDADHLQTLQEEKEEYGFETEHEEILDKVEKTFNEMRGEAKNRVIETCVKGKKPLAVYPEGGRSYDGFMKKGAEEFAWFFPRNGSALIVPYIIYGAREVNPPGAKVKILRPELFKFWRRQRVSMKVGPAYSSAEVLRVYKLRRQEEGGEINPMDWVMANLANVDPDPNIIRIEDLRYYRKLMMRHAPERNRIPEEFAA